MNFPTFFSADKKLDDRLSPILVKELRQGMRGRIFVTSFLLLQAFLLLLVLANLLADSSNMATDLENTYFWVIVGFILLLLMPLRGLTTISLELQRNTLETVMLTRMTAWRVVVGKWSALFSQSLLFVSAVLPYLALRYFIGGNDVFGDFKILLFMLWSSAILIACSIAVSSLNNLLIRLAAIVGVVSLAIAAAAQINNPFGIGGTPLDIPPLVIVAWLILFGFFIPAMLFELAASGFAPLAENHAVRRRTLALAFFASCLILEWISPQTSEPLILLPLLALISVCYYDLSEKPRLSPNIVEPLRKRSLPGRFISLFFLPGWPGALLFSVVMIPVSICIYVLQIDLTTHPADLNVGIVTLVIFGILGSILIPAALCHLIWHRTHNIFMYVVLYNVILSAAASLLSAFAQLTDSPVNYLLVFFPSLPALGFALDARNSGESTIWYGLGNTLSLAVILCTLAFMSFPYFRELSTRLKPQPDSPPPFP